MCLVGYYDIDDHYHEYRKVELGITNLCDNSREEIQTFTLGNIEQDFDQEGPSDSQEWDYSYCDEITVNE
jgi:hypothetical protein